MLENLGGELAEIAGQRVDIGAFPWRWQGGEACICRVPLSWRSRDGRDRATATKEFEIREVYRTELGRKQGPYHSGLFNDAWATFTSAVTAWSG